MPTGRMTLTSFQDPITLYFNQKRDFCLSKLLIKYVSKGLLSHLKCCFAQIPPPYIPEGIKGSRHSTESNQLVPSLRLAVLHFYHNEDLDS